MNSPQQTLPGEHLTGLIERVTFHNEESGFCVLKVKVRGHRQLVTVVGVLPRVTPGEWLDARGAWVVDPSYGQQLRASELRVTPPATAQGIEKYLSSGAVHGIGPFLAARLVEHFGTRVLQVIEHQPDKLLEVPGIGPTRRDKIVDAWQEQQAVREIMLFLHSHGVSTARAFRIYKTYGADAIEKVQQDPYCLARDIRGIGFASADAIAMTLGIDRHSELRARAGVEHVLTELTGEGHCAYPRAALLERAAAILEIPQAIVETALDHEVAEGRLVQRDLPEHGQLIYLRALHRAEQSLARNLLALAGATHPCPRVDVEKAIAWVERRFNLSLAEAQREALALATRSKVLVITGGPGVGKTTLVKAILAVFLAKKLHVVLCAPTGRAAKRLAETTGQEAKTIHRLLEVDPSSGWFRRDHENPLTGDVIVVDETSMVDLPLADHLVRAVPRHAALVLVGDVDQLPSVGPGCVLRDVIDSGVIPVCRLTHVFRQAAESSIITNAHRVNQGQLPLYPQGAGDSAEGADLFFVKAEEPAHGVELLVRLVQEAIPRRFGLDPLNDVQVLTPMQKGELGARNLNLTLQAALNPKGDEIQRYGWTFRVGDRVMQMENDYDKDVFNGDIGRVARIDHGEKSLTVRFEGREVDYDFGELDELALAYATTVHKSQGSEYDAVVVPVHTQHYVLLQRNLLYTAITRARRLVVLLGTPQAMAIAVKRVQARQRITTLVDRLHETGSATR